MWGISQFSFSFLFSSATQAVPSYDYIIRGGGMAGLTIAARLSEGPSTTILILEAGNDHSNVTSVLSPGLYTIMYGDPEYDWNYKTIPQIHANGQEVVHPQGKQLGGSSAINFLFWTHARCLGAYFTKSETYLTPSSLVASDLDTGYIESNLHGKEGPINNTFQDIYRPLDEPWPRTYEKLGITPKTDLRDGFALGGYTNLIKMDLKSHTRSYADTAYWLPTSKRLNLKVVTRALVEKILLEKDGKGNVTATGVRYSSGNKTIEVKAKKEAIFSAGSIGSPQILELSGIGDPELLDKHGIEVFVPNKHVGENLQVTSTFLLREYKVIPGITILDNFTDPDFFNIAYKQYIGSPQIECGDLTPPAILKNLSLGLADQYVLLNKYLRSEAVTQELTVTGGMSPQYVNDTTKPFTTSLSGNFFTLLGVLEHPFSRGSVHIQSSDPIAYPTTDPQYLSHPFNIEVLSRIVLHLETVAKTPPLSFLLKSNGTIYQPRYHALNSSNVAELVKKSLQSEYHPADASVFSLMPRGILQTLVYAVAERAVEFVRGDVGNCL
ncbi:alcohol oxidase [Acephala macrosclerotiorum]|nr:alcohol oxidase [Acephala macrosclerotiorum]